MSSLTLSFRILISSLRSDSEKGEYRKIMLYEAINTTFYGFDTAVYRAIGSIQSIPMNKFAWFMTFFGGEQFFYIMMALAVVLCFPKKTRKYGMSIICGLGIAYFVTNFGIKLIVQRPRPFITLRNDPFWGFYEAHHQFAAMGTSHTASYEPSFSFPSGHTTNSFSYTTAFILAGATSYKTGTNKHRKWQYWFIPLPILVGLSRIYIFVHYPSDVLFGMLNGILWGTMGFLIANALYGLLEERRAKKVEELPKTDRTIVNFAPQSKRNKENPYDDPTMVKIGARSDVAYQKYMEEKKQYEKELAEERHEAENQQEHEK